MMMSLEASARKVQIFGKCVTPVGSSRGGSKRYRVLGPRARLKFDKRKPNLTSTAYNPNHTLRCLCNYSRLLLGGSVYTCLDYTSCSPNTFPPFRQCFPPLEMEQNNAIPIVSSVLWLLFQPCVPTGCIGTA